MNIVLKPEDRCPYAEGTNVVYWHWADPKQAPIPYYRGVVETLTEKTIADVARNLPDAQVGEKVIRIEQEDGKPCPITYDPIMVAPVMKNEPQRWYAEGTEP